MKLLFNEPECTGCGACLSMCPKSPTSVKLLKCRHCSPESAPCRLACRIGAIKESNGFLFVSKEECNGCGDCASKCPYGAIEMETDKAVKCDSCLGSPKCADYCPEEALRIFSEREGLLGWKIDGEKRGYGLGLPRLTQEEESLIGEITASFRESSKKGEFIEKKSVEKEIAHILKSHCAEKGLMMEVDQFEYLSKIAVMQVWGFGPLDVLLADDSLEEIALVGLNKPIYVYRRSEGWLETDCQFTSQESFINLVNKMARPIGRRLAYQTPRLNAVLPDGSRLHASMPPISQLELTIRKFRQNPISVPELISFGTFSPESLAFLWLAMQTDMSIVVVGNTASGKTSTLNALFSFVLLNERVLITEETPEINIPHKHKVLLLANPELGIEMADLAADSLRMRPDRVVVGEARTPREAKALLDAITSGQAKGSYATFHADSGKEAIARLLSLGIPQTDVPSIDLIIVQKRIGGSKKGGEKRRVLEISEVRSEGKEPVAQTIFAYDYKSGSLIRTQNQSLVEERIMQVLGLTEKEFKKQIETRAKLLLLLSKRKGSFFETIAAIQNFEKKGGEGAHARRAL